jgi:hypothetical protein
VETFTRVSKKQFEERLMVIAGEIERHNTPDCIGVCVEKPFGRFSGIDVMLGMFGVAIYMPKPMNQQPAQYQGCLPLRR